MKKQGNKMKTKRVKDIPCEMDMKSVPVDHTEERVEKQHIEVIGTDFMLVNAKTMMVDKDSGAKQTRKITARKCTSLDTIRTDNVIKKSLIVGSDDEEKDRKVSGKIKGGLCRDNNVRKSSQTSQVSDISDLPVVDAQKDTGSKVGQQNYTKCLTSENMMGRCEEDPIQTVLGEDGLCNFEDVGIESEYNASENTIEKPKRRSDGNDNDDATPNLNSVQDVAMPGSYCGDEKDALSSLTQSGVICESLHTLKLDETNLAQSLPKKKESKKTKKGTKTLKKTKHEKLNRQVNKRPEIYHEVQALLDKCSERRQLYLQVLETDPSNERDTDLRTSLASQAQVMAEVIESIKLAVHTYKQTGQCDTEAALQNQSELLKTLLADNLFELVNGNAVSAMLEAVLFYVACIVTVLGIVFMLIFQ